MKSKKLGMFIFVASIVMVIAGSICVFVISLNADREETQKRMGVVNKEFESFNEIITTFEAERDSLYTEYFGNVFYDTLETNDPIIKTKLTNYEKVVNDITKKADAMKDLCEDVYYPDSSVNSKCSDYKLIYEQVVNYFVEDVKLYNDTIKTFNEQQAAAGSTFALMTYKTEFDYIDYNKDGSFDGKEVK